MYVIVTNTRESVVQFVNYYRNEGEIRLIRVHVLFFLFDLCAEHRPRNGTTNCLTQHRCSALGARDSSGRVMGIGEAGRGAVDDLHVFERQTTPTLLLENGHMGYDFKPWCRSSPPSCAGYADDDVQFNQNMNLN